MMRPALLALVLLTGAAMPAHATECIDLSAKGGVSFAGRLRHKVFAGPPGFKDVRRGDTPEPTYVLELDRQSCATGDDMIVDGTKFGTVQVYNSADDKRMWSDLNRWIGREVMVRGPAFGAHTGHHHAPVVLDATSISLVRDVTESYGTAQTTVEAFYAALSAGNGEEAVKMVVPEKRTKGPFSGPEITRFYRSMDEPLRLVEIAPNGPGQYRARYTYMKAGRPRCDGEALVTTRLVGEFNLIAGIKALRGC